MTKADKKTEKKTKTYKSDSPIKVEIVEHNKIDSTYNNYLVLSFSGFGINNIIMNTIRRVIMELVPNYAFDKKDIDITENTSIYNSDYMRLRLYQFPIFGIDNDESTIEQYTELEYEANISTFEKKIEDINIIEERDLKDKAIKAMNFIMYVNIHNTSNNILNVTTKDAKFSYLGKPIKSPYDSPLLIIKLKPGEKFSCTAHSSLNIGLKGANYIPTAVCVFSEDNSEDSEDVSNDSNLKEHRLNIESLKQISEKDLIIRACKIINMKIDKLIDVIKKKITEYQSEKILDEYNLENKNDSDTNELNSTDSETSFREISDDILEQHKVKGIIKIENESHTFGNLISRYIQDHPTILFGGYKIDHLLVKELTLGYKTDGNDIINVFTDIKKDMQDIFTNIINEVSKLKI